MLKMKQPKKHKKKRINDQLLFTIGFAVSNVLEPDISFFEGGDPAILHRRYTFHLGWAHSLLSLRGGRNRSKYLSVSPQFRWDRQADGTLNTFTLGANFFQRTTYLGAFYTFTSPNGNGPSAASVDPVLAGGVRSLTVTSGYQFKLISRGRSMLTHQGKRETNLLISLSYDYVMGGLRTTTGGVLELGIKANLWSGAKKNCAELSKFELYKGDCPAKF
jgi:hypothetical protein